MILGNYEILIESTNSGVKEILTKNGFGFVGISGASYTIKIINNDPIYRIWASLYIDGVSVMLDGYGRLAEPQSSLSWKGFQVDKNNVREFIFSINEIQPAIYHRGSVGKLGIMNIRIVQEKIEWYNLNPPEPMMMFMSTSMGDFRESRTKDAKIKFKWGGPEENIEIPYGSMSDFKNIGLVDLDIDEVGHVAPNNERWYRLTYKKEYWDSFSSQHEKIGVNSVVFAPNQISKFLSGTNESGSLIFEEVNFDHSRVENIRKIVDGIIFDPIKIRLELDSSKISPHVEHFNRVSICLEKFEDADCKVGHVLLFWDCNAMMIKSGLLKAIDELFELKA